MIPLATPLRMTALERLVRRPPLAVLALVFVLGHLAVLSWQVQKTRAGGAEEIFPDSRQFVTLAGNVVTTGQFSLDGQTPSARREPGYVVFVALFTKLGITKPFDPSVANQWPLIAAQISLFGIAAYGLARFAARAHGPLAGVLSLAFAEAWWPLAKFQHLPLSECIVMAFLAGAWLALSDWGQARKSWAALLAGAILFGCACVTKSIFVLATPVLVVFMFRRGRVPALRCVLFGAVVLAMPLAWTARNQREFGLPIMGSIDGVSSLYRGNVLPFTQIPAPELPEMPDEAKTALAGMNSDAQRYVWYKSHALDIMRGQPVRYALQCGNRVIYMLTSVDLAGEPAWRLLLFFKNTHFMLMLLLALHLPALLRGKAGGFFTEGALLMFLVTLGLYGLVYGETRYMYPWMFVMAPLYAAAAARLVAEPLLVRFAPSLAGSPPLSSISP
ncbi:MAG: hypothetical protein K1X78_10495 [Verrucomicrobiaceae bacterium]|nr:hypothetical protein [Verrucomicrobiaceae bacterium]